MNYLKCNNCGHLNIIKTEYQTFCSNCQKKLDNNYSDWKKGNSDKTFQDFKQLVCVSEKDIHEANSRSKPKKSKGIKFYIGLAITIAVFLAAGKYGGVALFDYFITANYDKIMMKVASEINKSCPMMIDSETQLDNAIALPDNVLQYNYTLVNILKETIDIDMAKAQLEPNIVNFVKTSPDMKFQRDYNTTINYSYKDKAGVHLFVISVTPEKYLE